MARYNHYFPNFSGGEISPQTLGRSDTDMYKTSAETIDNFIVQIQGGLMRRPGFKYIAAAAASTEARLISFKHSSGSEYVLEFTNLKFRIFKNGAVVGAPTEVVTTYVSADLPTLSIAQSGDTMVIAHENYVTRQITRSSDTSWTIADVPFVCAPMYPLDHATYGRTKDVGNTAVRVISLTSNTLGASATLTMNAALFSSSDVGKFMRIKSFTPDAVSEANATITDSTTTTDVLVQDGSLSLYDNTLAHEYNIYQKFPSTTTSTRTTGYSTVVTTTARSYTGSTGSTSAPTYNYNTYVAGQWVITGQGTIYKDYVKSAETVTVTGYEEESWGLVKITGYTSATVVTVTIMRPLAGTTFHTSQQWQMSRFGANTGYPKRVAFHEGRCYFGNIGTDTNLLVASKTGKIYDFENGEGRYGTLTAATALDFTLSEVGYIQWIQPSQKLLIGANNGAYSLAGSTDSGINPLEPPLFRRITSVDCSTVPPVFIQGTTIFTHGAGKKVGGLVFKAGEYSGFDYVELSKFADHLILDGIKYMTYSRGIVWIVTSANELRGITFNTELNLNAWHRHDTTDLYTSLSSLGDELYVTITRAGGQYVEIMSADIQNLDKEDVICVDSALTYSGSAATVITGLSHLNGETVDILADGAAHPQAVVSGGQITLVAAATKVQVGLPYVSTLKTTEVVGGNRRGASEGRDSRIHEVGVKLLATNGAKVIAGTSTETELLFNEGQVYGDGPDLFTGTKVQTVNSGTTLNPTVTVKSQGAFPISILGVSVDTNISET